MSRKEWPFQEAERILKRIGKMKQNSVIFETGYGPSGLPHIGTFSEVARTSFVVEALKLLDPSVTTKLITFSDDMDGLRSIPENVPNKELLEKNLGKPLSQIPDPYEAFDSYSDNMNSRLKEFLTSFGFKYTFMSASQTYTSGIFNNGLKRILENYDKIKAIFTATISEEKREKWSPFFPICENCGKMYTTVVTDCDVEDLEIAYRCINTDYPGMTPCGHKGITGILNGKVKVAWKVDWALRWLSLGVTYEMHGKDLLDSVTVSRKVIKLLGGKPPLTYKYELFFDDEGRKLSKKLGNGLSVEQWLRYAPVNALLYFMYVKPNQPKRMSLSGIPKAIEDYRRKLAEYKGNADTPVQLIQACVNHKEQMKAPSSNMDYTLILNLVSSLNTSDLSMVMDYLVRYDPLIKEDEVFFTDLVKKAIVYNNDVLSKAHGKFKIDHTFDRYLESFCKGLEALSNAKDATPDDVQTLCFATARDNELETGKWFTYLYQVLLSQERGPKLGPFICLYGIDKTLEKIRGYLAQNAGS